MGDVTLLVVTGLLSEARVADGPGVAALAGGGDPSLDRRLEAEIARLRPTALLSFGVAGALSPEFAAGDLLVATAVAVPGSRIEADPAWSAALARATGALSVPVAGTGVAAATPLLKRRLRDATGASAVDMESHTVALLARERGLPFAVLRAVSDTATDTLPAAALAGMRPDGRSDALAVVGALALRPWELPALLRTARGYGGAMAALRTARNAAGERFALPHG